MLLQLAIEQGDQKRAMIWTEIACCNYPSMAEKMHRRALELRAQAKVEVEGGKRASYDRACVYLTCILTAEPEDEEILREYGGLCYDFKEYKKALSLWEKLAGLHNSDYYNNLCDAARVRIMQ